MTAPAGTMRITTHPRHHDWVILKFGPELNPLIGTFPPAQQALDLGGYVLHTTQLDALHTWARHHTIHLLDDTQTHPTGPAPRPVQCGNTTDTWTIDGREYHSTCAAPYPTGQTPATCPACGQAANPIQVTP